MPGSEELKLFLKMTKKIFDILPPSRLAQGPIKPLPKVKPNRLMNWRSVVLGLVVILGAAAVLYQVFGTEFVLYLEPNTRITSLETEFQIDGGAAEINFEENVLPGYLIVRQELEEQSFTTSGEEVRESRAEGIIRVYNAETPVRGITLRATTRFLSSEGVYFRTPESVYLPPAKIEGGRVVPSSVDVPVEAMDPGEGSNIGPSKFSVPGLLGTTLYDKIDGESLEPMTGGAIERLPKVTQADLRQAEESLKSDLIGKLISKLESEDADRVVLPEATEIEILSVEASVEAGALVETFASHLEAEVRALVFSRLKVEEFLADKIKQRIGQEYLVVPDSFYLDYRVFSFDDQGEILRGNLKFSAEIYQDLEEYKWVDQLPGLRRDEVREVLLADERIKAFQFRLRPFWLRRVPDSDKTTVELRFKP